MSDATYKKVKLGDLGYTYPGLSGKSKDDFGSGKPYIPYMNIFSNAKIKKSFLEYVDIKPGDKQNKVQKGDLFFTTSSETVEEVGMTSVLLDEIGEAYLNSFCFGFRLYNFDVLLPEFAAYLFRSEEVRKKISLFGQGSTRYNLPKTQLFDKLYLNIPDKDRQIKIYNILTTCDTVIEQTQAATEKYKAIKQGMLHDLFTRGLTANGQLRPTPQQAPELYKQSELGLIPKEWEVKRLEELTTKIGDGIHTTPIYVESSDYHFINGNNLSNGFITISGKTNCVSTEEYEKHKIQLNDKTLLMSINGTIGNLAYYRHEKVILGKSAAYICCNDIINEDYLFYLLSTKKMTKYFEDELTGSTIKNLSLASIRKSPILYPKIEEQIKLVNALSNFDTKLQSEEALLSKYQAIKKGLMNDLLSGKRPLTPPDKISG